MVASEAVVYTMRTLSARILVGFAALTVTFGAITGNIIFNQWEMENEIKTVGRGYVPLALISKELAYQQDALAKYLDKDFENDPSSLRLFHPQRDQALINLRKKLTEIEHLPLADRTSFEEAVKRIEADVAETLPYYQRLAPATRTDKDAQLDLDRDALDKLRAIEARMRLHTSALQRTLEFAVDRMTIKVEDNEHRVRIYTIYFGATAVFLGILITVWVVITLRPLHQLREAARRVAAGDYGKRIAERGPIEVKDLARELNSMARAVEVRERELVRSERLAAIGKMAAMIAHEVRNPLSSIGLNTELLDEELGASSAEAKQLLGSIHHEVDRLSAITEEYLSFARLPKPKVTREPVNKLVTSLADFVREDLAVKNVTLAMELTPADPIALIDAAQIRQCLINLVRNASEAVTAKGGGKVMLRTHQTDERVVIEVEDDGTGIAADVLPRLFDPFFSTKESGSGLGLALTQQIVKDHGGDVSVESTAGKGTTFRVSVPAAA
jgi:two-component system, NtrC family, sensor kinase